MIVTRTEHFKACTYREASQLSVLVIGVTQTLMSHL